MIDFAPQPWIGNASNEVTPSSGGAIQLPSIGQPDFTLTTAPRLPSVSSSFTGPLAGYERVTKFLLVNSTSYTWITSSGTNSGWRTEIPHCSFCGERFSLDTTFHSVVSRYQSPSLTQSISFAGNGQTITLQDLNVEIHKHPRKGSENAPSVHSICWKAFTKQPSIHNFCNLGRAMIPLVWTRLPQSIYRSQSTLSKAIQMLPSDQCDYQDVALYILLKRCERLPTELVAMIWDFVTPCTVRCLLALWAAKSIQPAAISFPGGSATIFLNGDIKLYLKQILDGVYICGIRQGYTLHGSESDSSVNITVPLSMIAFVFTRGTYGLRKMEFITELEPHPVRSLASKDSEFVGVIYPQPATPLHIDLECDALKISRISCHNKSSFGHDFLWMTPLPWTQIEPPSAKSFYHWPRHFDFARHPHRIMVYIPLSKDGFRLYGLTAFCSNKGLVGLGTHFHSCLNSPRSDWYGEQKGCPIHVQFGCSETIHSVSVFWQQNDPLPQPYLIITTSKSRTLTLGPCYAPAHMGTKNIFSRDQGDILGLYYDQSPGIPGFTSMGATCCPRNSLLEHISNASIPQRHSDMIYPLHTSPSGGFASQASFTNVKILKACYMGPRCKGMLLIYDNDTRSILGQWYESTHVQPDIEVISFQRHDILRFYLRQHDENQILGRVRSFSGASPLEKGESFVDVAHGVST
ncbi:hypothetical protein BDV28DRAFT_154454 [Aspergillus coremiiformis]|uniref:Uncharacterized protein n=1 Tax=Aspergillus coremiiformis TaxID=138285 RepID=A0A5N6ZGI7_9EURO|nr:hypothetical protein BDV28DRAFT_154454 [Aspergillus coremiiformis]